MNTELQIRRTDSFIRNDSGPLGGPCHGGRTALQPASPRYRGETLIGDPAFRGARGARLLLLCVLAFLLGGPAFRGARGARLFASAFLALCVSRSGGRAGRACCSVVLRSAFLLLSAFLPSFGIPRSGWRSVLSGILRSAFQKLSGISAFRGCSAWRPVGRLPVTMHTGTGIVAQPRTGSLREFQTTGTDGNRE